MSRIGKKEILIPEGVNVKIDGNNVNISGKIGQDSINVSPLLKLSIEGQKLNVIIAKDSDKSHAMQGLCRMLIQNAITGTDKGFTKRLDIVGVGYRVALQGSSLILSVGYSHPVEIKAEPGVAFKVEKNSIIISGSKKEDVGNIAAKIRAIRPPEPYKGKGIRYSDEVVLRKAGKTGKAGAK